VLTIEDMNNFIFEFEVLYRTYEYIKNDKKTQALSLYIEGINFQMFHEIRRK
jgi:hypothetical protein